MDSRSQEPAGRVPELPGSHENKEMEFKERNIPRRKTLGSKLPRGFEPCSLSQVGSSPVQETRFVAPSRPRNTLRPPPARERDAASHEGP